MINTKFRNILGLNTIYTPAIPVGLLECIGGIKR